MLQCTPTQQKKKTKNCSRIETLLLETREESKHSWKCDGAEDGLCLVRPCMCLVGAKESPSYSCCFMIFLQDLQVERGKRLL
jgi:hypothetical protein